MKYSAWGEEKTLVEWSKDERCVVSYDVLRSRFSDLGWGLVKALTTPPSGPSTHWGSQLYEAFGEAKTMSDWVEDARCVVARSHVTARLSKGWAFEQALSTPTTRERSDEPYEAWGESKGLAEWARDRRCVVGYYTLKQRVTRNKWDLKRAMQTPARRKG